MLSDNINSIEIFGVKINRLTEGAFLNYVKSAIQKNERRTIAYANADTLNKIYGDPSLKEIYGSFDLIHPDGVGVYLASGFLYKDRGFEKRLTGSDFYETLIKEAAGYGWSFFFFGHSREILGEISRVRPGLNIAGIQEGYNYSDSEVVKKINAADPDIVIIGLSCPVQEKWMHENIHLLNCRIILATGDGIKVFAGKKVRGPVFLRKLGLEWTVRYFMSPFSNFRRYVIGVPQFIFRIFKEKLKAI